MKPTTEFVLRETPSGVLRRRAALLVRDTLTPAEQKARFQAMRDKRKAEIEAQRR